MNKLLNTTKYFFLLIIFLIAISAKTSSVFTDSAKVENNSITVTSINNQETEQSVSSYAVNKIPSEQELLPQVQTEKSSDDLKEKTYPVSYITYY